MAVDQLHQGGRVEDPRAAVGHAAYGVCRARISSPCQWCGNAVAQPPAGRLLRYCDRSCRQRAYEARTARRRLGEDVDAGLVREQPAERIVRARHPRTAAGWEAALKELRAQLADGRIGPWHRERLRAAVALVDEQLHTLTAAGR